MTIRWCGDEAERITHRAKGKRGFDETVVPLRMPIKHHLRPGVLPLPPKDGRKHSAGQTAFESETVADSDAVTARWSRYEQGPPPERTSMRFL